MIRLHVLLLLGILSSTPAAAQFRHFTVSDGLASENISVIRDFEGDLLFGTFSGGVARFDGVNWRVWNKSNGFPADDIHCIEDASDGSLLIGCEEGIVYWDGEDEFRFEPITGPLGGLARVAGVVELPDSTLWIATNKGVARKIDGTWNFELLPVPTNTFFTSMHRSADGAIWTGTQFEGLFRFEGSGWDRFGKGIEFSGGWINNIDEDSDGNVWISTPGGGVRYRDGTWRKYTEADGLPGNNIMQVTEDSNGDLWFAIGSVGFSHWDGEAFTSFGTADGLLHETAHRIHEDDWGGIWIGSGRGLSRFDRSSWAHFTDTQDGLSGNRTYCVLEDAAGDIWVGGLNGVSIWNGSTWSNQSIVPVHPSFTSEAVLDIEQDASGRMWFATNNGLAIQDSSGWTYLGVVDGLPHHVVTKCFEDSKGRMWVAAIDGVSRLDSSGWVHYSVGAGLATGGIYNDIAEDHSGNIWVSGDWAILRWTDAGGWEEIEITDLFYSTIEVSPDGVVWAGGFSGVYRYDDPGWTRMNSLDGLVSNSVNDLAFDDTGAMWISTFSGLNRMRDGIIGTYTTGDGGLPVNSLEGLHQDSKGFLWISGEGVTRHAPDRVHPVAVPVAVPPPATASRLQTITWDAGFKDSEGARYQTSFDGGPWSNLTTLRVWSLDGIADGPHELLIRSIDLIGNVQILPTRVPFVVDGTPPTPTITAPGFEQPVSGEVEVVGTADDPRFVNYVVDVSAQTGGDWVILGQGSSPVVDGVLGSWNTGTFAEGRYDLRVSVLDDVGLVGRAVTRSVIVDNEAPFAEVISPVRMTSRGGEVFSTNGEARLYFPPGAFLDEAVVRIDLSELAQVPEQLGDGASRVWEGVHVSWEGSDPVKAATLDLRLSGPVVETPAVYVQEVGGAWEFLGGTWTAETQTVALSTSRQGLYAVFTGGTGAPTLPSGLSGITLTPRVLAGNSPPLTIGFSVDRAGPLTVQVYNRAGRLVRSIVDGTTYGPGVHAVRWNGSSENGSRVEDGLYLVAIEALGMRQTKTIAVAR